MQGMAMGSAHTTGGGHTAMAMGGHTGGGGHMTMAMGGMSMSVAHGATNILPSWLAVIWTFAFLVVVVVHARHVLETRNERRWWHCGHVGMALGMLFMYAPASLDHFNIPTGFWQLLFANAAGVVLAYILACALSGRAVNVLWAAAAFDYAAMAYMWSPSGFVAPLTWLLVAYFAAQGVVWGSGFYRRLDERPLLGGHTVNPDGTLTADRAPPLLCERDLRPTLGTMAFGMAYMFAAIQLLA